ncbi:outer membrane beta-barrel protein [Aquimarina algiphila]|uniref:outer membrane beta-barrel protein n=1 Tax=Aquimarina algiphila TaxID=2047982 RepID=UPI00232F9F97|nr:outer membrane beta-barrel protein [Aquimarina algiphila]
MKKILLTITTIASFIYSNAQEHHNEASKEEHHFAKDYDKKGEFEQGDIFVSALFGFDSKKKGEEEDIKLELFTRVGYLISETIIGGIKLGYERESETEEIGTGLEESKSHNGLVGIFGRYDFTPGHKFSLFGELGVDYLTADKEVSGTKVKEDGYKVGLSPGLTYFLTDHFAIEAFWGALSYESTKVDGEEHSTDEIIVGFDFEHINFGLAYKF